MQFASDIERRMPEPCDPVMRTCWAPSLPVEMMPRWYSVRPGFLRIGAPDCTPGYYNNEGQDAGPAARYYVGYPAGASAYFSYLAGWRDAGSFEGLSFR